MDKILISLITIGHMPIEFDYRKIERWNSNIFAISGEIENYPLRSDSDGPEWEFTNDGLEEVVPKKFNGKFLVALVNVPLELNWYTRRLSGNRVVFSFHEIKEILNNCNIPLENVVLRILYEYTLVYLRYNGKIPSNDEESNVTHDETRQCIFDMNGVKRDIIYSLHEPIICSECVERLKKAQVSNNTISKVQEEIRKIKKPLFYRMMAFIKTHPIWSMIISAVAAIFLGIIASIIAAYLYEFC